MEFCQGRYATSSRYHHYHHPHSRLFYSLVNDTWCWTHSWNLYYVFSFSFFLSPPPCFPCFFFFFFFFLYRDLIALNPLDVSSKRRGEGRKRWIINNLDRSIRSKFLKKITLYVETSKSGRKTLRAISMRIDQILVRYVNECVKKIMK